MIAKQISLPMVVTMALLCMAIESTWAQVDLLRLPQSKIKIQQAILDYNETQIGPTLINGILYFSQLNSKGHPYFDNERFFDIHSIGLHKTLAPHSNSTVRTTFSTDFHDGPMAYCEATTELFVTHTDYADLLKPDVSTKKKQVRLKISIYQQIDDNWVFKEEFPFNNPAYSIGQPAINAKGDSLFFVSDQPGGFGKSDIYLSRRIDGQWQKPTNLGSRVNTRKSEITPFVDQNGKLYFASNGHKRGKKFNIYTAEAKGQTGYGAPRPLPSPINNRANNYGFCLHPNGNMAFFVSDRKKRTDNIYMALFNNYRPQYKEARLAEPEIKEIERKTEQFMTALVDEMKGNQFISNNVRYKTSFEIINTDKIPDLKIVFSYCLTNDTIMPGANSYSLSTFTPDKANPVQVLLKLVNKTIEEHLSPYLAPSKKVNLLILGKPDAFSVFTDTKYTNQYGGPIKGNYIINNQLTNIDIDESTIIDDDILVFLRTYGINHYLENEIDILKTTRNTTKHFVATKNQLRSIEEWIKIEMIIENAFCNF